MTQLALSFPPPLTAKQLAACAELQAMVEANKRAPATRDCAAHRRAALKATRKEEG